MSLEYPAWGMVFLSRPAIRIRIDSSNHEGLWLNSSSAVTAMPCTRGCHRIAVRWRVVFSAAL